MALPLERISTWPAPSLLAATAMAVVAVGLAGHFDAWSTGRLARRALMLLGAIAASAVVGLALLVLLGQQPGRTLALRRRQ